MAHVNVKNKITVTSWPIWVTMAFQDMMPIFLLRGFCRNVKYGQSIRFKSLKNSTHVDELKKCSTCHLRVQQIDPHFLQQNRYRKLNFDIFIKNTEKLNI